jgi:hypothetical protein
MERWLSTKRAVPGSAGMQGRAKSWCVTSKVMTVLDPRRPPTPRPQGHLQRHLPSSCYKGHLSRAVHDLAPTSLSNTSDMFECFGITSFSIRTVLSWFLRRVDNNRRSFVIIGEMGVGKSRLIEVLADEEPNVTVSWPSFVEVWLLTLNIVHADC